ncbi:CAP domain-containing protein [Amylibacter sp. IMCC11727]|uniref:CAP domain-containing protein n=1 Tax=Amylibacter sp. IMCC11727 TaxID=3039851 RepID=UPI00244E45D6|nr:CAP domain-containing protein [Amylibacter sp. IMCC11727]WGI20859.1 CAP domain-containing protein [Amylibacter sp. IMCC11727]
MKQSLLIAALLAFAQPALACSPATFAPKFNKTIPAKPDQKLFTEAVLIATNFERCKVGKRGLKTHASLRKAALIHSRNMAKTRKFSHTSKAGNARTVKDRAKLANLKWRWLGENIALQNRYQFGNRVPFRIIDAAACKFSNPKTGATIPPHTYASLAQSVTASWMNSKGHRENIQSRYAGRMATAVVLDASAPNCGKYYITQVFSN